MVLIFVLFESSCKKDNTANNSINNTIICDGNGKNTFYPLESGNTWNYFFVSEDVNGLLTFQVIDFISLNAHKYAKIRISISSENIESFEYFREDSLTHDIYKYINTNPVHEVLLVPANPYTGLTWSDSIDHSIYKVTNLSAAYTTPACSYIGLLEITSLQPGNIVYKAYYKKGLGFIAQYDSTGLTLGYNYFCKLVSASIK